MRSDGTGCRTRASALRARAPDDKHRDRHQVVWPATAVAWPTLLATRAGPRAPDPKEFHSTRRNSSSVPRPNESLKLTSALRKWRLRRHVGCTRSHLSSRVRQLTCCPTRVWAAVHRGEVTGRSVAPGPVPDEPVSRPTSIATGIRLRAARPASRRGASSRRALSHARRTRGSSAPRAGKVSASRALTNR